MTAHKYSPLILFPLPIRDLFNQVSSEHHQQIVESSQSAAKIPVPECAHKFEESGRFRFFSIGLSQGLGNRPRKIAEQRRLDLSQRPDEQEQISSRSNSLRPTSYDNSLLENFLTSAQRSPHHFQHALIVHTLQEVVRCEDRLGMFRWRLLKPHVEFVLRIAWRDM